MMTFLKPQEVKEAHLVRGQCASSERRYYDANQKATVQSLGVTLGIQISKFQISSPLVILSMSTLGVKKAKADCPLKSYKAGQVEQWTSGPTLVAVVRL